MRCLFTHRLFLHRLLVHCSFAHCLFLHRLLVHRLFAHRLLVPSFVYDGACAVFDCLMEVSFDGVDGFI